MPPNTDTVLERRNRRARQLGWKSYGQMRYWLPRFGVHRRVESRQPVLETPERDPGAYIDKGEERATASRLGRLVCPHGPELSRSGSYFCRKCDLRVNGNGRTYAADGTRRGDWRARLVRAVGR